MFAKSSGVGSGPTFWTAPLAMAWAIGCSEASSNAPARRSSSVRSTPGSVIASTRVILPVVTVPVLSSTTVSTLRVDSRTSGPLMSTPICAPRPVPTSSAVGVARPRAQGQGACGGGGGAGPRGGVGGRGGHPWGEAGGRAGAHAGGQRVATGGGEAGDGGLHPGGAPRALVGEFADHQRAAVGVDTRF